MEFLLLDKANHLFVGKSTFILHEGRMTTERSKCNLSESPEYVHSMWLAPSDHEMLLHFAVHRVFSQFKTTGETG